MILATSRPTARKRELLKRARGFAFVAAVFVALFFFPVPSFASCDAPTNTVTHNGPFTSVLREEHCTAKPDGLQACIEFAAEFGYSSGYCNFGSTTDPIAYQACLTYAQQHGKSQLLCSSIVRNLWTAGNLIDPNNRLTSYVGNFYVAGYYVSDSIELLAQCGSCVSDPINPASGAVLSSEIDLTEQAGSDLGFKRYYTSLGASSADFGTGWRHSFSRSVQPKYSIVPFKPYVPIDSSNSSQYADPATACTSGFAQLKSYGHISTWASASASYANGLCTLTVNGIVVGTLRVYSTMPVPISYPILVGIDATRDNGQLVSFTVNGGTTTAPPSINWKLQQTGSGFTLTDDVDTIEAYDSNGQLLSVTTRAGVVQTMNYESSGRLGTVTDSFGHRFSLSYDSQGRVSSVTAR